MRNCRRSLSALFAALLALAAQLGVGASVPRPDPAVQLAGIVLLCHPVDPGTPAHQPAHLPDCLFCPLCVAIHTPVPTLGSDVPVLQPPRLLALARMELPPPSRAPPVAQRRTSQPRAPPVFS